MGAISNERLENDMIDAMWSFLQMGGMKSNYQTLKESCMDLRQMMMQKTAGQRKDRPQDMSWDNLERVKATIIVEAMALVLSGDFESFPAANGRNDDGAKSGEVVSMALGLKKFCGETDCSVCPFAKDEGKRCSLYAPSHWKIEVRS